MLARTRETMKEELHWLRQIDPARVPRHIAVIMDGNGRWARRKGLPRLVGHVKGADTARRAIRACRHLAGRLYEEGLTKDPGLGRVEYLTLYTFSNENWSRPQDEVGGLMRLIEQKLHDHLSELMDEGVSVKMLGRKTELPASLRDELDRDIAATAENQGLTLYLALNYGGRREIVDAARQLAEDVAAGRMTPDEVTEEAFANRLYAPSVPDPELLIRTGGDLRVSNFLLWQIAYAELYVTSKFWPDMCPSEIYRAIVEFQKRDRRFGGLGAHGSK